MGLQPEAVELQPVRASGRLFYEAGAGDGEEGGTLDHWRNLGCEAR